MWLSGSDLVGFVMHPATREGERASPAVGITPGEPQHPAYDVLHQRGQLTEHRAASCGGRYRAPCCSSQRSAWLITWWRALNLRPAPKPFIWYWLPSAIRIIEPENS